MLDKNYLRVDKSMTADIDNVFRFGYDLFFTLIWDFFDFDGFMALTANELKVDSFRILDAIRYKNQNTTRDGFSCYVGWFISGYMERSHPFYKL